MRAASILKWRWVFLLLAVPALAQLGPVFRVDTNLVRVPCVVVDARGVPVTGLRREDFTVLDDGTPREITYLWQESDLPLTVGLVADVSGSQHRFIEQHRQTVLQFLERVISKEDRAFLVSVARQQRLVTDLTNSLDLLRTGAEVLGTQDSQILGEPCVAGKRIHILFQPTVVLPCGGSSIWNGVFFSAKLKLRRKRGERRCCFLPTARIRAAITD